MNKDKKVFVWLFVIALVLIMGTFLLLQVFGSDSDFSLEEQNFEEVPSVVVEGEIIGLTLYDNEEEADECGVCPQDRAVVLIDGLNRESDPRGFLDLDEGEEMNVYFVYSARPAKIKYDLELENGLEEDGIIYSGDYIEVPNEREGSHIVYHEPGDSSDFILPGVSEGDKIRFRVFGQADEHSVRKYEILN